MSNTFIEHSLIMNNFVVMVGKQIKDSLCRVPGDGVQYQWRENDDKIVILDASINCNTRDRKNVSFTEKNKEELQLVMFPKLETDFNELFEF